MAHTVTLGRNKVELRKILEKNGKRVAVDAEPYLREDLIEELLQLDTPFITKEIIEKLLKKKEEPIVIVEREKKPAIAREYDADIEVLHTHDVTGKIRSKGRIENFLSLFRDRFEKISRRFRNEGKFETAEVGELRKYAGKEVRVVAMIFDIRETKTGKILLEIDDLTGKGLALIEKNNEKLMEKVKEISKDDVVEIIGKVSGSFLIVREINLPDIPLKEEKKGERDLAAVYISDIHFGSKFFMEKEFNRFVEWVKGKEKIKYIFVAGDIVDGIGIYPGQEKELVVKDIEKQYWMFNKFVESLPDYIEVIAIPGNHDATRRAEPSPAIPKDLITVDIYSLGNPSYVRVEGLLHLIYHGTSIDSMIASLPGLSYEEPENVMIKWLKKRHLSPIYGTNHLAPEPVDYMVITEVPDVLHAGHVHRNGYATYRGVKIINSGTFQATTPFQEKLGHKPTPCRVFYFEFKTGKMEEVSFL